MFHSWLLQLAKTRLKDSILQDIEDALREGTVDIGTRITIIILVSLMCPLITRTIIIMTK